MRKRVHAIGNLTAVAYGLTDRQRSSEGGCAVEYGGEATTPASTGALPTSGRGAATTTDVIANTGEEVPGSGQTTALSGDSTSAGEPRPGFVPNFGICVVEADCRETGCTGGICGSSEPDCGSPPTPYRDTVEPFPLTERERERNVMADLTAGIPGGFALPRKHASEYNLDHGRRAHVESTLAERTKFARAVQEALAGSRQGQNRLAVQLLPLLRTASLRELRARGMALQRAEPLSQDVANDVFVELLKDGSRVLRSWTSASVRHDPCAFFRIIARRRAIDAFRRDRRLVISDDDTPCEILTHEPSIEISMAVRQCMCRTVGRCRDVEATQMIIYDSLVANARQTEFACDLGVTADAVYQRTSRFRREFTAVWNQE